MKRKNENMAESAGPKHPSATVDPARTDRNFIGGKFEIDVEDLTASNQVLSPLEVCFIFSIFFDILGEKY